MMTGAENAVMLTKLHTQRILLSTRLEWDMWEEACNFGWYVRQHNVVTRKASPQGRGPAPEKLGVPEGGARARGIGN